MSEVAVLGNGPISLMGSDGRQLSIPLSSLSFNNGTIQASQWPLYTQYKAEVDAWLGYLVSVGELLPGPTPPPTPAMVLQAADPGAAGNNIQVTFTNITPTTFEATIVETDTYPGLSFDAASPSFIKTVLGTETLTGTRPGLVHAADADTPSLPQASTTLNGLKGGGKSAKASIEVAGDPSGTAFKLEAKKNGADGNNTTVTISNVDASAKTFTLVATWTQSVTSIALAGLPGNLAGSGYEITVSPPAGGSFAIPAAGTVGLSGGVDSSTAAGVALANQ